jgi:hypothetical protein
VAPDEGAAAPPPAPSAEEPLPVPVPVAVPVPVPELVVVPVAGVVVPAELVVVLLMLVPPPAELVVVAPVPGLVAVVLVEAALELPLAPVVPLAVVFDGVTAVVTVGWAATFGTLLGALSASVTPPQPAISRAPAQAAVRALARRENRRGGGVGTVQSSIGPMRRPQVGQSLRSFWASCSHHGQKRRFSTAHARRERDGASGSSLPTTSSGSPVSRSL